MELDMVFTEYLERHRDNLKMGLAHGNFDDAIKIVFEAGYQKGIEFAVNFKEATKTEEL
jgi:hypothetical protein